VDLGIEPEHIVHCPVHVQSITEIRMMRWVYLIILVASLALVPAPLAAQITVLTEEPVAEFTLPDGSVLKNAFVWRRSSEGLMIIHDEGQYFLNFQTLPPLWKKAYLGDNAATEDKKPAREEKPAGDRYRIGSILEKVPNLDAKTREKLLERSVGEELDQNVLVIALMQAVLDDNREAASRGMLYIEEQGYEIDEVSRELLFESCYNCGGDGTLTRKCPSCKGSGECEKCIKPESMLGKQSSRDQESMTALGKRDGEENECEACEGSEDCGRCGGDGYVEIHCSKCRGTGKVVARIYCETVRDKYVRAANALVSGNPPASILSSPSVDIVSILKNMPGMNADALTYYASADYGVAMDTNIVAACLMDALVEKNLPVAKRFNVMLEVEYPDNEVILIEDYLEFCEACESKGWGEVGCKQCGGSGDCIKCEGDGDSMSLKNWEVECTDCAGSGKCNTCGGSGTVNGRCRSCMGLGRTFKQSRCEIRRELLVDELNEYYRQNRADTK
jgi:hypothetical protein